MKKTLFIVLAIIPLMWSCVDSTADKEKEAKGLDSTSYLQGRISGLDMNLGWQERLKEVPDSVKATFNKAQFTEGFNEGISTDTTSRVYFMGVLNTAQYLAGYDATPWSEYAPLDYNRFYTEFSKAFNVEKVDTVKLVRLSEDYHNMLQRLEVATPQEAKDLANSYVTLMGQGYGMQAAYQVELIDAAATGLPKIDRDVYLKGVKRYIDLMPKSQAYEIGFLTGAGDLGNIMQANGDKLKINIATYRDAFDEAFNESDVTVEKFNEARNKLSEVFNRQFKAEEASASR